MHDAEIFLLDFHKRAPGCTSLAFATGRELESGSSSYDLLAELSNNDDVLDLGCGDGHLLSLLAQRDDVRSFVGVDFSASELDAARNRLSALPFALARAQSMPFADKSFSLVLSHFAFHLMQDLNVVASEIARVLRPGGRFVAIVGGGPKLGDPFEVFLELVIARQGRHRGVPAIGERRGRSDEGLRALFQGDGRFDESVSIEDFYIDFGGTFDEVWPRLSTIYDLYEYTTDDLLELQEQFRKALGSRAAASIPCTMAVRRLSTRRSER